MRCDTAFPTVIPAGLCRETLTPRSPAGTPTAVAPLLISPGRAYFEAA